MAQNTVDDFKTKKKLISLKEISSLQVIFVPNWMKQTLIWFSLQKGGTGNGLSNINDTVAESLQLQIFPHIKKNRGLNEINRAN